MVSWLIAIAYGALVGVSVAFWSRNNSLHSLARQLQSGNNETGSPIYGGNRKSKQAKQKLKLEVSEHNEIELDYAMWFAGRAFKTSALAILLVAIFAVLAMIVLKLFRDGLITLREFTDLGGALVISVIDGAMFNAFSFFGYSQAYNPESGPERLVMFAFVLGEVLLVSSVFMYAIQTIVTLVAARVAPVATHRAANFKIKKPKSRLAQFLRLILDFDRPTDN